MSDGTVLSFCLITGSPDVRGLLRESIAVAFPRATVAEVAPGSTEKLAAHAAVVIDATSDPGAAIEIARRVRAGGGKSAIVLVTRARGEEVATRAAPYGAVEQVELGDVARTLGPALERALAAGETGSPELAAAQDELRRTQRLMAAGEIALGLQHSMNNPLTAILAEAQLLEMEELSAETRTAVSRIVENTRRLVALVRKLDAIGPKKAG